MPGILLPLSPAGVLFLASTVCRTVLVTHWMFRQCLEPLVVQAVIPQPLAVIDGLILQCVELLVTVRVCFMCSDARFHWSPVIDGLKS